MFRIKTNDGEREIDAYSEEGFRTLAHLWTRSGWQNRISYEVTWLGIPIIQLPEDILILQELIWRTRPTVIIESGVAHGGATLFYASMLELLGRGKVIGVDIEIRQHNRLAIQAHPLSARVSLIEASSIDKKVVASIKSQISPEDKVMVALDSNHSRDHVLQELEMYGPLVTEGNYLVVFDGVMSILADAPRGLPEWKDDNPLEAVRQFLTHHPEFRQDNHSERLRVTHCQGGYLYRLPNAGKSLQI